MMGLEEAYSKQSSQLKAAIDERDKLRTILEWIESEMKRRIGVGAPMHHISCAVHRGDIGLIEGIQENMNEGDK